jgi:hypothetical protein
MLFSLHASNSRLINEFGSMQSRTVCPSLRTGRLERELQMVQLSLGAVVSLVCESVY